MITRKKTAAAVLAAAAIGGILSVATPASAASGSCESGVDACIYYSPNLQGAYFGDGWTENYDNDYFGGGGAGNGQHVINNAASVWNMSTNNVRIYYSANETGPNQYIPAGTWANLGPVPWNGGSVDMRNNNHSQGWS